ncbi:MAG: hypothetical protein H0T47_24635 [Planctomycetaceae bacterium]|nr:hypothetical protein [Planctomycetaceae bacterium]
MTLLKKLTIAVGVTAAAVFASADTADAQIGYSPYYGYGNYYGGGLYGGGYGVRNFSYSVTNPNGSSVGYSVTTAPGYYGGYGVGYGYQAPYVYPNPAFGRGAYSYSYPGVFYTPGSYTFYGY